MLLNYAAIRPAARRLGLAAVTLLVAVLAAAASAGFFIHAARMSAALANAADTWCGTCAAVEMARVRSAGMAPENALAVAVFLAGAALVAGVQAVRFYNASAARRRFGAG